MTALEKQELISELLTLIGLTGLVKISELPSLGSADDFDWVIVERDIDNKTYKAKISNLPQIVGGYTDTDARAAMGIKDDANSLNHDKYNNTDAILAMGVKDDANSLNHDKYTDAEALIQAITLIDDTSDLLDKVLSSSKILDLITGATFGIKYFWADSTARNAQVGMSINELGLQQDSRNVYQYDGAIWTIVFNLDGDNIIQSGILALLPGYSNSGCVYFATDYKAIFVEGTSVWELVGGFAIIDDVATIKLLEDKNNTELLKYIFCKETNTLYELKSGDGIADDLYWINIAVSGKYYRGLQGKYTTFATSTIHSKIINSTLAATSTGVVNIMHGLIEDDILTMNIKTKLVDNLPPVSYKWINESSKYIDIKWDDHYIILTNNSTEQFSVNSQPVTILINYKL